MSHVKALEVLILDGGVLTEWLACRYEATDKSWRFGRFQKHALRTPTDVASFEKLLERYPNRLPDMTQPMEVHAELSDVYMSAYAIAEVQRHARDTENKKRPESRRAFWTCVDVALEKLIIHERHLPWLRLDRSLVVDFGPADASLIALAQELTSEGARPCIATMDRGLRLRCAHLQVTARDVYELMNPDA